MDASERIAKMRQISKPAKEPQFETAWILVEIETGRTIGVFSQEETAWNESEAIQRLYQIETEVEMIQVDARLTMGQIDR